MVDPWNFDGATTPLSGGVGVVTLVDESTFAISGTAGDIVPGGAQGLFFRDTRLISRLQVLVNGSPTESLTAVTDDPFTATFVSRCLPAPGRADSTLMVFRVAFSRPGHARGDHGAELRRRGHHLHGRGGHRYRLRRPLRRQGGPGRHGAARPATSRPRSPRTRTDNRRPSSTATGRGGVTRGVEIVVPDTAKLSPDLATFHVVVPSRGEWSTTLEIATGHRRRRPAVEGSAW